MYYAQARIKLATFYVELDIVSLKSGSVTIKQKDNITGIRTAQRDEIQDLIQRVKMICIHKEKINIVKSGQYTDVWFTP